MLNLKQEAFTEIEEYIHLYDSSLSRYEIDKNLLNRGYEPDWIDRSWQNRVEKQKRAIRYRRTEIKITIVNIALLLWFLKPNIPMSMLFAEKDTLNQLTLIPVIILFLVAIIFWYIMQRTNKPFIRSSHLLTIAPLVFIVLLSGFDFLSHYTEDFEGDYHFNVFMLEHWKTDSASYTKYEEFSSPQYKIVYKCDDFGLLCFEVQKERQYCCG